MARWNRIRGPALIFSPPATPATIPGMVITDFFGEGPLFVAWKATHLNQALINLDPDIYVAIDGVRMEATVDSGTTSANTTHTRSMGCLLLPIPGTHTITLDIFANGDPGEAILADTCVLSVIELPLWDTPATILGG